jgi:hypothetical protein
MAETWAVWTVVEMCPWVPHITTDCLGILNIAKGGTAAAVAASNPNARIWKLIADATDGDITKLSEKLVWMPSHQNESAIGQRYKSDGRRISCLDHRANKLVDKLATHRMAKSTVEKASRKLVKEVKAAAGAALATLGQVTWHANNYQVTEINKNGEQVVRTKRDSVDKPKKATSASSDKPKTRKTQKIKPSETFDEESVRAVKKAWLKKKSKANARRCKKTAQEPKNPETATPRTLDRAKIKKYTELCTEAAQEDPKKYVSFRSFLGINAHVEDENQQGIAEVDQPKEEASATPSATTVHNQVSFLQRVMVDERPARARPTKGEPKQTGKKGADEAILKLLGGGKSAGSNLAKGSCSKPSAEAPMEGPSSTSDSRHAASSHVGDRTR